MTDTTIGDQTTGRTTDQSENQSADRAAAPGGDSGWLAGEQRAFEQRDESVLVRGIDRASNWASAKRQATRDRIVEHPLGSAWVIFGLGVFAGLILARR